MEPTKFDDLTKALATSTSRRQALKTIAATTLGGLLGLSGLGTAFAKNKTCAQWCDAVFGANTPAAEQCSSDAAHGNGLCQTCGSATLPSSMCCVRNGSGFCTSYSGAHCPCDSSQCLTCDPRSGSCTSTCRTDQICSNGSCGCPNGSPECNGVCCDACSTCQSGTCVSSCGAGQVCVSNGTCVTSCAGCQPDLCPSGTCDCNRGLCVTCPTCYSGSCSRDTDCPKGQFCEPRFGLCYTAD